MAYGEQQEFATINRVMMWWSALISVVLLCFPLAVGAGVPNPNVTGPIRRTHRPATLPMITRKRRRRWIWGDRWT